MSGDEGEGLLDSYRCLSDDWLSGIEAKLRPQGGDAASAEDDGKNNGHGNNDEAEAEMEADSGGSGGYLLSASRVGSNSSEFTDTTSTAYTSSSSSDSSDEDDDVSNAEPGAASPAEDAGAQQGYLNSEWDTNALEGQRPAVRPPSRTTGPHKPLAPPPSPLTAPLHRSAQPVVKGKHGLRATRLSINSLPNLLGEKTEELDLDYREINVNELELEERPIGKGAFGTIYKGYWRGAKVAIKKLNVLSMTEKELYEFRHEVALMKSLCNHPNVVDFIGACTTPPHFCLVSKFYANGSVKDYLDKHKDVPWITLVRFARDAAAGVLHLHCEHVVHRDIAARNALVDDNLNVRVSDFGLARRMTNQALENTSSLLPVTYMAPESIRKREYSIKSDSFSFGIFLWEILTRQQPFAGMPLLEVAFGVTIEGLRLKIPDTCPDMFRQLMGKCWETNPEDRPDFYELFLTLEEYLEQLEIEEEQERERKRKLELTKKMEMNDPNSRSVPSTGMPSLSFRLHNQGRRNGSSGRVPLRIRSTPMLGNVSLLSPFGVSAHPFDRSAEVSGRMARSETMLLDKKNLEKKQQNEKTSPGLRGETVHLSPGSAGGEKGAGMESGEHPIEQAGGVSAEGGKGDVSLIRGGRGNAVEGHRVRKGLDGRELRSPRRKRIGWADQEDLQKSSELFARLSKDHAIDPARIINQFPFENGTHSLICKAKLVHADGHGKPLSVAVKRLSNFLHPDKNTHEELLMLSTHDCANVVRFLGANLSPDNEFLVFQWVKHGSLAQLMYGLGRRWKKLRKQKPLLLVRMAHDVAKAMHYLHEKGIAHCNLEPKNILLDSKYRALLCGFSLARFVCRQSPTYAAGSAEPFRQPQSSILFSAPEVWNTHLRANGVGREESDEGEEAEQKETAKTDFSYASDVYSFGMLLWTLWHGFSHEELKKRRKLVRKVWAANQPQRKNEEEGTAADEGDNEGEDESAEGGQEQQESVLAAEREAKEEEEKPRRDERPAPRGDRTSPAGSPTRKKERTRAKGEEKDLRDLMLADRMPNDWLNLTEACLSFRPEERPSFDVILPTLKNIWKSWKDSLEAHGDIDQAAAGRVASVTFPAPPADTPPFVTPARKVIPREAEPDYVAEEGEEEEEEGAGSLSRSSSSALLSMPSPMFEAPTSPFHDVPSSLSSLHSFSLSPPVSSQLPPSPTTLKRSAQSSPAFLRLPRGSSRLRGDGAGPLASRQATTSAEMSDEEEDERLAEARRSSLGSSGEVGDDGALQSDVQGDINAEEGDLLDSYEGKSLLSCVPSSDLRREL